MLVIVSQKAHAQFEGTFNVDTYSYANNGKAILQKTIHVAMTPDRIMIRGLQGTQMPSQLGGIQSNAVLIRLDKKDFIILSDNKQALQIQKSEIENLVNMTSSLSSALSGSSSSQSSQSAKPKTVVTNQRKKIDGYNCQKIEVTETDKTGHRNRTDVWVTKAIPVNWGMLAKPWNVSDSELSDLLSPAWLKNGTMPIRLEFYQDGIEKYSMRVAGLKKQRVPSSETSIPPGYQLVSIRQLLMNKMFSN